MVVGASWSFFLGFGHTKAGDGARMASEDHTRNPAAVKPQNPEAVNPNTRKPQKQKPTARITNNPTPKPSAPKSQNPEDLKL